MRILKYAIAAVLLSTTVYAQKLPTKQQGSLQAPATIKIDGKATEWNNKFQAYNKATDIFYTIANNADIIYLTVQAQRNDVISKILSGGITFTVNSTSSKTNKGAVSTTYPVLRDADQLNVVSFYVNKLSEHQSVNAGEFNVDPLNKKLDTKSKLINVSGITTITGGSISVYNQDSIKAVAQFDSNMVYTYELALPSKYLALPANGKFSYQIKVNAPVEPKFAAIDKLPPPPPPMAVQGGATAVPANSFSTDFWGEYTLAK